jgi:nucleotide-binding universal stress UspA family protein
VWTDVHEQASFVRDGCPSVIYTVDLWEEAVPSMQWAAQFAQFHGAEVTVMRAIPALAGPTPPGEVRFRSYLAGHAREYIEDLQWKAGFTARTCIEGGKIAETVREAALHHAANLVVIGGCIHETLGRLRSNAHAIIRRSPCPVVRV